LRLSSAASAMLARAAMSLSIMSGCSSDIFSCLLHRISHRAYGTDSEKSEVFTGKLKEAGIRISMDGRGRIFDNIMIQRLWRSVKYEEVDKP
jgi:transposase InsO family protein